MAKISLKQAAEQTGLSRSVLARWCRNRVLQTAEKVSDVMDKSAWLIEENELQTPRLRERIRGALFHGKMIKEGFDRQR